MPGTSFLSALMVLALSCAVAEAGNTKQEAVTATDQRVILAALAEFNLRHKPTRGDGATIPVHLETKPWSSYTAGQIMGDLKTEGWSAPQELLDAAARRNSSEVSLRQLQLGERFPITDVDKLRDRYAGVMSLPDEVPAVVYLSLPGYSRDRKTALLRFYFAPSAHGAAATYLLVKERAGWRVKQRAFTYYA